MLTSSFEMMPKFIFIDKYIRLTDNKYKEGLRRHAMEEQRNKSFIFSIVATVSMLCAFALTLAAGIEMLSVRRMNTWGAVWIAFSLVYLSSAILGAVSLKSPDSALASAIMSAISAAAMAGCTFVSTKQDSQLWMSLVATLLSVLSVALYLIYYAYSKNDDHSERQIRAVIAIAIPLSWIAHGLSFTGGILGLFFTYSFIPAIVILIITWLLFATFIMGIVSFQKPNLALACSITSAISAVVIICCASVPLQTDVSLWFLINSGLISFVLFVLYAVCYAKHPRSQRKDIKWLQYQADMNLAYIDKNEKRYQNGEISEEEFRSIDEQLKKQSEACTRSIALSQSKSLTKKQIKLLFIAPSLIMVLLFSAIIPTVVVKTYETAYARIERYMSSVNSMDMHCGGAHSSLRIIYEMPDSYKDIATIKSQYTVARQHLSQVYNYSDGNAARQAYLGLKEIETQDRRWNFDGCINEALLYNATWASGDYYLTFLPQSNDNNVLFDTNLPNSFPSESEDIIYIIQYIDTVDRYSFEIGCRSRQYGSSMEKRSALCRIKDINVDDSGEFSIKVYLYETEQTITMTLAPKE